MRRIQWRTTNIPRVYLLLAGFGLVGAAVLALERDLTLRNERRTRLEHCCVTPQPSTRPVSSPPPRAEPALPSTEEVGFDFRPSLEQTAQGSTHVVHGNAGELPEGTVLHCELLTRGPSRHPIRLMFMRLAVKNGVYAGSWDWHSRSVQPGIYEASVSLRVSKQNPDLQAHFQREHGWPSDHLEHLARVEIEVGSAQERAANTHRVLEELNGFLQTFDELLVACQAHCTLDPSGPGTSSRLEALTSRVRTQYRSMRAHHTSVVVRREDALYKRLINLYSNLSDSLRAHDSGDEAEASLAAVQQGRTRLRADLAAQLSELTGR